MIVGVLSPSFSLDSFGGSVEVAVQVVNSLAENGYRVILLARRINPRKLFQVMGESLSRSIKIIEKPSIVRAPLINAYESAVKLLSLKMRCDVTIDVYSCCVFPWSDICYIHFPYINNLLFKQKFPYLTKRRGILSESINLPYIFFEKNFEKFDRKLLIANSYFTANAIKQALGADAEVLYPPISNTFLKGFATFGKTQRENLVVTVGRITEDKKLWVIPQIANMLRRKNIKFVMVGLLHDRKAYEKINAEIEKFDLLGKVKILTNISRSDLIKIFRKAKVYLHPPTIEHFGISIAEAMAMGCIPVVYKVGGAKEFVPSEYIYENVKEASERVEKAVNSWSVKEAKKMNSIAQGFSDTSFRRKFAGIFSEYCQRLGIHGL